MNLQTEISPELWEAISKPYESKIYSNAVLEAIHYLSNALRERTNLDGDGVSLVGRALGGNNPLLCINKFQTENEKDEQKGFEQILRGIYQGIRNPRSHSQFSDNQDTANKIILFLDYILGLINKAKEPFTIEEWITRVFDPYFVESKRYTELLVSEVPVKKYVDTLITLFRSKDSEYGNSLSYVFAELITKADNEQLSPFYKVISDELKVVKDESTIKLILQILPAEKWPSIDEAARIRIENILIESIKEGKYDKDVDMRDGWLGTWAQDYVKYFTLRYPLYRSLIKKLRGSEEEKNYVGYYFLRHIPTIVSTYKDIDKSEHWYEKFKNQSINAISSVALEPLKYNIIKNNLESLRIFPEDWQKFIIEKLKPLEDLEPEYYKMVIKSIEDVPF